jgi:hypothetical protein
LTRRLAALVVLLGVASGLAGGCSKDEGSQEKFCAALPTTPDLSVLLEDLDTADPTQLDARLSKATDQFHRLAKAAPDPIADDVDTVADTVDEILGVVEDNLDDRDALRKELAARKARLLEAGPPAQRVVDYAKDVCGIDLGG